MSQKGQIIVNSTCGTYLRGAQALTRDVPIWSQKQRNMKRLRRAERGRLNLPGVALEQGDPRLDTLC
jgi:hypothetical protein